jgi:hypothetical protein
LYNVHVGATRAQVHRSPLAINMRRLPSLSST